MIASMDHAASKVAFRNRPSAPPFAPPPAYSASNPHTDDNHQPHDGRMNRRQSSKFHLPNPNLHNGAQMSAAHSQGQLVNDCLAHHSSQISQHPQAIQASNQIPQHHVSSSQSGPNDKNNNNNNIVILPQVQQAQPLVAAPYPGVHAPQPHVTAINFGGPGIQGPTKYRREANHLVHCLLSILFPPWMFVWCVVCCCYGCPNVCCCCGQGDICDSCCPKYEEAPTRTRTTTWI